MKKILLLKDGTAIPGAINSSYRVSQSGNYSLRTYSFLGCLSNVSSGIAIIVNPVPPKPSIAQANNNLQSSASSGNQWFLNGSTIAGATGNVYSPLVPGLYSVQVTQNGCISQISDNINYIVTAITAPTWSNEIQIYPSPVQQNLFITSASSRKYKVQLYDMKGRILIEGNFISRYEVNMNRMAAGTYVVTIINEKTNEKYQKWLRSNDCR